MKYLTTKTSRSSRLIFAFLTLSITIGLSACSNSNKNTQNSAQTVNNQQTVELGTVVGVRQVELREIDNRSNNPLSNVGVSASSGGYRGIYAAIDVGTLARLFKNNSKGKLVQEVTVKKRSGETVAITQAIKETFKTGETVKILYRNGYAHVTH